MEGNYPKRTVYNMRVRKGATWRPVFRFLDSDGQPVDITGYHAELRIGSDPDGLSPTNYFTLNDPTEITLGDDAGTVIPELTDVQTLDIDWEWAVYECDLIDLDGQVIPWLYGKLIADNKVL